MGKNNKPKNKKKKTANDDHRHPHHQHTSNSHKPDTTDTSRPANNPSSSASSSVPLPPSFPAHLSRPPDNDFLLDQPPFRESFQEALETSYEGFVVDDSTTMKEASVQNCLEEMQAQHYFRRDVTQPFGLGTKCAKTYVTRCLVGGPGTTYRYLGLRMFAHPWKEIEAEASSSTNTNTGTNKKEYSSSNSNRYNTSKSTMTKTVATTQTIHQLSQLLSERTKTHLQELDQKRQRRGAPLTQGRSCFDICLINCMDPSMQGLKSEPSPTLSDLKTTVSWHADSSLEHYSTIAVYQTLVPIMDGHGATKTSPPTPTPSTKNSKRKGRHQPQEACSMMDQKATATATATATTMTTTTRDQWYVAMRVTPHAEGPTVGSLKRKTSLQSSVDQSIPPIAASLPSGSAYYLLDDFNHHHQHTVLLLKNGHNDSSETSSSSSSCIRYSCTYRLLRDSHNVEYMIRRCQSAVSQFHKKGLKLWRSEQLLLTDIESEWIRQFYIQGSQHYDLLWEAYWKEPMLALLRYWSRLEHRTQQTIDLLQLAARGKCCLENNTAISTGGGCSGDAPSKAERKAREKQKKALATVQGLLQRSSEDVGTMTNSSNVDLYESMAELLEERAQLRALWAKREKDHVFTELSPELRPIPLPFRFLGDDNKDNNNINGNPQKSSSVESATSPLPGDPDKLQELAATLRAYGKAFVSGRPDDLPILEVTKMLNVQALPIQDKKTSRANDEDPHAKALDWSGWAQPHVSFGLELQDPWASAVMDGRKEIETRSYDLPPALIGKRIWILESPSGTAGVSAMGNIMDLTGGNKSCCRVLGWCIFTSVIRYTSRAAFEADECRHLVSSNSGYAWKDDRTKHLFGWVVGKYGRVGNINGSPPSLFVSATRRMRSLFELKPPSSHNKRKSADRSSPSGKRKDGKGPTKRKRY